MENTLKICKVRNVKTPCRAHATDAGIDFFVPTDLTEADMAPKFETTGDKVEVETKDGKIAAFILKPNESVLIPSGIHVNIPDGYALIYMNKSGIASKKNLHIGACLVDQNYQGECHLNLTNVGNRVQRIEAGDKIAQGVVMPINYCQVEEIDTLEKMYSGIISDRGIGGFGSSGIK